MTLKIKSILSLLLAFLLTFAACSAAPHKERVQPPMSERILQIAQGMKKLAGVEEGDCLLNASDEFPAGSSVCDWAALACAVGGAEDSYTAYLHALEAYAESYITYPIDTIVVRTGIAIEKNKRNGRNQVVHLERARAVQNIDYPNGEWRNKDGRPDKSQIVVDWRMTHPDGTKAECIRETGLSKPTVYSWWKKIDWVELRSSMNRENMVQLSGADQQQAAQKVVVIVERIAKERGISEEEAYKMFLKGEY